MTLDMIACNDSLMTTTAALALAQIIALLTVLITIYVRSER